MNEGELFLWLAFAVLAGFVWWLVGTLTKAGKETVKLLNQLDAQIKDLDKRVGSLEKLNKVKT
jgi:hypothetical protein